MEQIVDAAKSVLGGPGGPPSAGETESRYSLPHMQWNMESKAYYGTEAQSGRNKETGQVGVPLAHIGSSSATADVNTVAAPSFDPARITVVYVLGGPGAGKGTQCAKLVAEKSFVHLSAGDLLRAEQNREGSEVGQLIRQYIKEGTIVPMEITIGLLRTAMQEVC